MDKKKQPSFTKDLIRKISAIKSYSCWEGLSALPLSMNTFGAAVKRFTYCLPLISYLHCQVHQRLSYIPFFSPFAKQHPSCSVPIFRNQNSETEQTAFILKHDNTVPLVKTRRDQKCDKTLSLFAIFIERINCRFFALCACCTQL